MLVQNEKKLEDILIELGVLSKEHLDDVKLESAKTGKPLEEVLQNVPGVSKEGLVKAIATNKNVPYVDLSQKKIDKKILNLVSWQTADKYKLVPFGLVDMSRKIAITDKIVPPGTLDRFISVAMLNPNDLEAIDYVEKQTGYTVNSYMASEDSIAKGLSQYNAYSFDVNSAIENVEIEEKPTQKKKEDKKSTIFSQDAPITRVINTILEYAAKSRASDIHLEPRAKEIKVRYRVDGILYNTMGLPLHVQLALVSRIKILSNLKIDEHRISQDGRFQVNFEGREIDLRVSVIPITYGEKVVIRLLDKSKGMITLEELGIKGRAYKIIQEGSKKPHGMTLSTGPTGSGKSTTLYAVLSKLNTPQVNIVTIEDPVEYNIDGINQIQVNPAVGLTFSSGLRSILRQDPNVIMVGEIRDKETAELAVQSALTGHTVLSTLHTNSAPATLPRLLDMDIEPFLIASTVSTVMAQRLVRRICENCKEEYLASPTLTRAIKGALKGVLPSKDDPSEKSQDLGFDTLPFMEDKEFKLYKGRGCEKCNNAGFWGRIGIYEIFPVTPKIEDLILARASSYDIQEVAVKEGMVTMRQDGFLKALAGITTMEEVVRTTTEV